MKKKLLLITIIAILSVAVFTACGGSDDGDYVTWRMMIVSNAPVPASDNWIMQAMRDELGVNLVFDVVSPVDQDMRIATMLAGDGSDLPDIIHVTQLDAHMAADGAFLRLDEFFDSGRFPLLAAQHEPYRGRLSFRGGDTPGLYQMTTWNRFHTDDQGGGPIMGPDHGGTAFWIQKSVLEFHDFPDLTNMTLERYFNLIEAYMQANPTIDGMPTIGFTFPMLGRVWGMTNPPQFLAGFPNNGEVIVRNGVASIYHTSVYAEYYWRVLNDAFHRGIVDPESWTRTEDEYFAALAQGRVLGFHDQGWAFGDSRDSLIERGLYSRTWVPTMPLMNPATTTPWYADRPVLNVNQGIGIPFNSQNPEEILDFFEALMSPEWQLKFTWGREGIDFHVDDNGMFYRTPEQRHNANTAAWRLSNQLELLWDALPKIQGSLPCGNAYTPGWQPSEFYDGLSDYFRMFLAAYGKGTWTQFANDPPSNPPYFPAWQAPIPGGSDASEAATQIQFILSSMVPGLISAPVGQFDALWAEFVAEFDRVNVAALEAQIQLFIDERIRLAQ